MRARASGSADASSRSTPARTAARTSRTWAGPWASARMSSASEIVTPSKPRSRRSRSVMTARDSVPGRSSRPVTAGSAMCPDIASRAPAANAARNGTNSRASSTSRAASTTASPWCVSLEMCPIPGACLTVAATPAACSPRTIAAPCRPTAAGESPNDRIPSAGLAGFVARSRTGRVDDVHAHRPRLGADRATRPARSSPTSSTAPRAMLPAKAVEPSPRARNCPPSWSAATSIGEEPTAPDPRDRSRRARRGGSPRPLAGRRRSAPGPGPETERCETGTAIIPAAGAAASRSAMRAGSTSPSNASMTRPRIAASPAQPFTAPASPRTK